MSDEEKPKPKEGDSLDISRIMRRMDSPQNRKGRHSEKYKRPRNKITKVDARKHIEALQMVELRQQGKSLDEIGKIMGCTKSKVSKFLHAELEDTPIEGIEDVRKMELLRLDKRMSLLLEAQKTLLDKFESANTKLNITDFIDKLAILDQRLGAISQERRKMMGLDKPVKAELTGKDGSPLYQINVAEINVAISTAAETLKANEALLAGSEQKQLSESTEEDIVVEFVEEEKVEK